jgi:hypothetical protein
MNLETQACQNAAMPDNTARVRVERLVRRSWYGLLQWLYLYIWCRHCYRHVMRLAHRYHWHYAPPSPMSPLYGKQDHWCQWCGLRGVTWKYHPDDKHELCAPNS